MNKYDKVIGKQFGIIQGEKYLVFIKTGRGGTIEGFKNKYLSICDFLFKKYGYTFVFPPILKIRYVIWRKK